MGLNLRLAMLEQCRESFWNPSISDGTGITGWLYPRGVISLYAKDGLVDVVVNAAHKYN